MGWVGDPWPACGGTGPPEVMGRTQPGADGVEAPGKRHRCRGASGPAPRSVGDASSVSVLRFDDSLGPWVSSEEEMGSNPTHISRLGLLVLALVGMWLAFVSVPVHAGVAPLPVDPVQKRQVLDGHVEVIFDRTQELDFEAIEGSSDWTAVGPRPYVKGLDRGVVWFRMRIRNPSSKPVDRLLQISSGLVDEMTVWVTDESGAVQRFEAGENAFRFLRQFDAKWMGVR